MVVKMLERLKQIPKKIAELWKKYTSRQKFIIISAVSVVAVALVILIIILNKVTYTELMTFKSTSTAKEAMALLDAEQIAYQLDADNVTLRVDSTKRQAAILALTDSDLMSERRFTLEDLLNSDMSTTNGDKQRNNHLYIQSELNDRIGGMDGVDKANVLYFPADRTNSILTSAKEISCSVVITINDDFEVNKTPKSIANMVAAAIGNSTTDKIKIVDQHGNLLFGGDKLEEAALDQDNNLRYKKLVEKWYSDRLYELAVKNGYYDAQVSLALDMNFDKVSEIFTEYFPGEGLEQGYYDEVTLINSENTGVEGGLPGTDSNDETDYYIQNSSSGESTYSEQHYKYKNTERVTETIKESGAIDPAKSSGAFVLTKAKEITQESLERDELLAEMSFEEYVAEHSEKTRIEVEDELYQLFSDATGIPRDKISILAYEQPNFIAKPAEAATNLSLWLEILLAALIVGLLLFVVFRAVKPEEVIETEPELSVERLLATTKENQSLEDIEFGEKSETRKMVEKYIDENAEAVAALLKNWLNDDGWGE
ncbi:MAG: hypothetical protein MJ131_00065 [Lachnospiraceae bacterium]|nr:hypothetical protein [Lachnospiraceae bacterium]